LELIAGKLPEHTQVAYLGAFHAFPWPGTQTPPFDQITQQGCQSNRLELRIPKTSLLFAGSGPENFLEHPLKVP